MCRSALDGSHYNGRKAPAQVSGGHGARGAAAPLFLCVSLCEVPQSKTLSTYQLTLQKSIPRLLAITMRLMVLFTQSEDTNQ